MSDTKKGAISIGFNICAIKMKVSARKFFHRTSLFFNTWDSFLRSLS